ncbi:MAG: HAMP domain-containing histidine kinase [Chloroflexi bacterium]|nr:HAMP domain-containing histidine kinase [Chloroflexota bacterium]
MEARPLELSELRDRLRWFISLRWMAAAGVAAIVAGLRWLVGIDLQVLPLLGIALTIALYNLAFWLFARVTGDGGQGSRDGGRDPSESRQGRGDWPPTPRRGALGARTRRPLTDPRLVANVQIAFDLVALTFLLHFVGGVENPFFLYYVFHVIIASILLSRKATYLQATFAAVLFASLAVLEAAGLVPHVSIPQLGAAGLYDDSLYVAAVLASLTSTLYFSAFMATSIVRGLRVREAQVMELKEALEKEEVKLKEAYDRLQEVDRFKSRYMRKASHELRAPLSSIQSLITVALEGFTGNIPSETREILSRASTRTRELLDLVSDLLALSRAREIRPEQARQPVSLAAIAAEVMPLFQAQAVDKGLTMAVSVQPDLPQTWADPEGMEELLSNLVSNAIKYTPAGGEARVTLAAWEAELILSVSDTGIGIEPQDLPHLFEEFFRSRQAREMIHEGTGLGLSIVKAIVDAHGGRIEVRSRPGEGTTFVVALPVWVEGRGLRVKDVGLRVEGGGLRGKEEGAGQETGKTLLLRSANHGRF